jgi:hypothetical protein
MCIIYKLLKRKEVIMKNIKGDITWALLLLVWVLVLVIPDARTVFIATTEAYPYIGGFVKFAILASMGDMLGARILTGKWTFPQGFFFKAVVWGVIGMMVTLVFAVFMAGASGAMAGGKLPFQGSKLAQAVFGSVIMNSTFGPMMYIYHKVGDLLVDMSYEKKTGLLPQGITVKAIVDRIDWYGLVSFSWLKTCIFIWMPLHAAVFLLPSEYRVLASAFLSILLGILVALSKKSAVKNNAAAA